MLVRMAWNAKNPITAAQRSVFTKKIENTKIYKIGWIKAVLRTPNHIIKRLNTKRLITRFKKLAPMYSIPKSPANSCSRFL